MYFELKSQNQENIHVFYSSLNKDCSWNWAHTGTFTEITMCAVRFINEWTNTWREREFNGLSSLRSTSQTGQTDMAEKAATPGVEAMTNALTPGERQTKRALTSAQAI